MEINVYGPDYKQYTIDYIESEKFESEAYRLVESLFQLRNMARLPIELTRFYEDCAVPRVFLGNMPWTERRGVINRTWRNSAYRAAGNSVFIHSKMPGYAQSAVLLKEIVKDFYKVNDSETIVVSLKLVEKMIQVAKETRQESFELEMIQNYLDTEMKHENIRI